MLGPGEGGVGQVRQNEGQKLVKQMSKGWSLSNSSRLDEGSGLGVE